MNGEEQAGLRQLDISAETCPMTFVRTRLALDKLPPGALLLVRLRGAEPLENVPKTATEQGHSVLETTPQPDGSCTVLIRKATPRQ